MILLKSVEVFILEGDKYLFLNEVTWALETRRRSMLDLMDDRNPPFAFSHPMLLSRESFQP